MHGARYDPGVCAKRGCFSAAKVEEYRAEWLRLFSGWHADNVATKGVFKGATRGTVRLDKDHPVVHFLRVNEGTLDCRVNDLQGADGLFTLSTPTFTISVDVLRKRLLAVGLDGPVAYAGDEPKADEVGPRARKGRQMQRTH